MVYYTLMPEIACGPDDTPARAARRGDVALDLFGYEDSIDEKAATVIADILHAVAASGADPREVLERASTYYIEERP